MTKTSGFKSKYNLVDVDEISIEEAYDGEEDFEDHFNFTHEEQKNPSKEANEEQTHETNIDQANQWNDDIYPGRDICMDYTNVFTTMSHFGSRDELLNWVRRVGNEHKIVIVIRRSDNGLGKKKARVILTCERSGVYRQTKRKIKATGKVKDKKNAKKDDDVEFDFEEEEESKERRTGTKKCECPFMLTGTQIAPSEWTLEVKCGTHNHSIANYLEGHSFAGRLTAEEERFVIDMSKCNAPPKSVLEKLKEKNKHNHSTIRNIYNARKKYRVVKYSGRSQLQYLMSQLVEKNYFQFSRRCEKTNTLMELFFAHPICIQLVHAFPKVLLIDCTYKTNRYRLPYLEIVGVTSTGKTFLVASMYLLAEKEENYTWALGVLRSLLGDASLPSVIITDREKALMNAVASKFPKARHFLCTYHIAQNVLARCKGDFASEKQWEAFNAQFNVVWTADSVKDFEDAVHKLHSDFAKIMKPVNYVMTQWINPYKERFVRAWTNEVMHYGNTTTNRVESHHSALKRMLGNSMGNFETCWEKCHTLFEACHTEIKASFEKSVNVAQHKFASNVYNSLRGLVSIVALDKLFDEIKEVKNPQFDSRECKHVLRKVYGLPCAHEIEEYVYANKPIPINAVDSFWRKLDFEPTIKDDAKIDIDNRFEDVVGDMAELYKSYSQEEKLLFLRKMRELANPGTTNLVEPSPRVNPRGRPKMGKGKKLFETSTKRDPSLFEVQPSLVGSCPTPSEILVSDTLSSPLFSKKGIPQKKPIICKRTRLAASIDIIDSMPMDYQPYIVDIKNVKGDGHCGFRAIASLMKFEEKNWARVRQDLMIELTYNTHLYHRAFRVNDRVDEVLNALNCFTETALFENWFWLPYMGYLVASKYNTALIVLDPRLSLTILPFRNEVPERPKSICIALVNQNHFVQVTLGVGRPLPPIDTSWTDHHSLIADGWLTAYNAGLIS